MARRGSCHRGLAAAAAAARAGARRGNRRRGVGRRARRAARRRVPAWPLFVPSVATTLERWHRAQPAAAEKPLRALERLMRDFKWPLPALWWWEASRALIV